MSTIEPPALSPVKQKVFDLLKTLPDDCTFEDVQYHLYVLETIQRRLDLADAGETLTQAEVEKRAAQWLSK